jgi:hypothetical protein
MSKKLIYFLFFILLLVGTANAVDDSLVAWWKLDDGSGTTAAESSGNGNNGTLEGNPEWTTEGKVNGALNLDGDGDYVDCGEDDSLDIEGEITVCAWVNIRSVSGAWMAAVAKGENSWRLGVNNNATTIHWGVNSWTETSYSVNSDTDIGTDEWHHLAGTHDGTDIKIYIDGVLDNTTEGAAELGTANTSLLIGDNPEATGRYCMALSMKSVYLVELLRKQKFRL